ncbi:hypothetical protein L2E82_20588 [Cichorium intybus]|uniref:Uncharacterized protein n=1 Tax=Cichorium intybus TaxID=13427 RepID=A0ACB9DU64_CICIN|nr:hypothetical protein L2E82_20588 [Cichorium intybus]
MGRRSPSFSTRGSVHCRKWNDSIAINTWDFVTNSSTTISLPVEYAWKHPSCSCCLVFRHNDKVCAAAIASHTPNATLLVLVHVSEEVSMQDPGPSNDGFALVTKKKSKPNVHNKQNFKMSKNPANFNPSQSSNLSGQIRNLPKGSENNINRFPPPHLPCLTKIVISLPLVTLWTAEQLHANGRTEHSSSIYDINMNDLNGSNRFDVLNSLDESFTILCNDSGLVSPITPPPSHLLALHLQQNSLIPPAISPYLTSSMDCSTLNPSCEDEPIGSQLHGRLATCPPRCLND